MNDQKAMTTVDPAANLIALMQRSKSQIEAALPKHLTADRMMRLALTTFRNNPALQRCDPLSVVASVVMASQCGLEIGILGRAYLVPYKGKCQFIPGWKGLVDLVNRTGKATVWSGAVFEGDVFEYQLGDAPFVKHVPKGEDDPRKMTHVYACGQVNGAQRVVIEVWPVAKIWRHRDRYNKVGDRHYSYDNPEAYARKIPLLRVMDYMPQSIEMQQAILADTSHSMGTQNLDLADLAGGNWIPSEAIDAEIVDEQKPEPTGAQKAADVVKEKLKVGSRPSEPTTPAPDGALWPEVAK